MWPFKKKARTRRPAKVRKFAAAELNRLTASWDRLNTSIDRDLMTQLPYLRGRSRDLCANNEYAKRFIHQCRTNIVGPVGITLQNRAKDNNGTLDDAANSAIEAHWKTWSMRGNCDVTSKLSRADFERLIVESVARDGEVLFKKVPGYDNDQRYGLQLIEADYLDHKLNRQGTDGSAIRMGVELDGWGKPTHYHLLKKHPGDLRGGQRRDHEIVPASEIVHLFIPMRAHQTRGVPWMHAAMLSLYDLGGYREAAIVAARVGASKMGIFVTPTGEEYAGDDKDSAGNIITEAEPGTFEQVPEGTTLESWDPTYPHDQFESFNKAMLRGMAGGLGVAYHTFASDLEGVNFSSARAGVLEERDMWMVLQQWLVDGFNAQVYPEWLLHQLMERNILLPNGSALPAAKFDKYNAATWQPRRWAWVDPLKDIKANREAIDARVRSISSVIREAGDDPDDVFLEIQTERAKLEGMGIPILEDDGSDVPDDEGTPPPPAKNDDSRLTRMQAQIDRLASTLDARINTDKITKKIDKIPKPVERAEPTINISVPPADAPVVNVQNDIHVPRQDAPVVNNEISVPAQPAPDVKVAVENNVETPSVTVENTVNVPSGKRKVFFDRDRDGDITEAEITDG